MNIIVSACLLGIPCRYDGSAKTIDKLQELCKYHTLIPVCPEQLGGLSTPRNPAERIGEKIISNCNEDVTIAFTLGAKQTLHIAQLNNCKIAILKERSPSCGNKMIYDGTFTGKLIEGSGVCAELLTANGIIVYGESDLELMNEHNCSLFE